MTTPARERIIGAPVDRVDGRLKVTGAAPYSLDFTFPDLMHAVLVQSTIAAGTIRRIDAAKAQDASGVLAVLTHENVPALVEAPASMVDGPPPFPLKDRRIWHHGQHLAVVVARTREQAAAAARLVEIDYEEADPVLRIDDPRAPVMPDRLAGLGHGPDDVTRGDVTAALSRAEVAYDEVFTTAAVTPNPMGLFATVARWEGNRLTVHDSNQDPMNTRKTLAAVFDLPEANVRVLVPYLGGGFGSGLRAWPHVILTALAARVVGCPVKLVLTRPQMFTSVGHRPESRQRVRLGSTHDGRLVALAHESTSTIGALDNAQIEPVTQVTGNAYACPNVATHDQRARLNIPSPHSMRGPGTAQGNFALESALDELSYALGIDPIELRLRNYTEVHQVSGQPWSSKSLRECYRAGAERFGWERRTPETGSIRDGNWLVGYGMAGVTFTPGEAPCQAAVSVHRDGTAHVRSAATDLGTGTYTIATQVTAELLGLDIDHVHVEIGDSDLPFAPYSGGSAMALSLSGAIQDAVGNLVRAFLNVVAGDESSPLRGRTPRELTITKGAVHVADDRSIGETFRDVLARHGLPEITASGERDPWASGERPPLGSFAAWFAEVHVDVDLGQLRVARIVSAVDAGRILNKKLARSQVIGGAVMGIGMTLLEENVFDVATGRITNATFSDYLIPTNADVPDIDVVFVGKPDTVRPLGIKGLGEISCVGVSAAIANAVYHAIGRRIRSLPITVEQLL